MAQETYQQNHTAAEPRVSAALAQDRERKSRYDSHDPGTEREDQGWRGRGDGGEGRGWRVRGDGGEEGERTRGGGREGTGVERERGRGWRGRADQGWRERGDGGGEGEGTGVERERGLWVERVDGSEGIPSSLLLRTPLPPTVWVHPETLHNKQQFRTHLHS